MKNEELMTTQEIHDFGIKVVLEKLTEDGHKIVSFCPDLGTNPQIVVVIGGRLSMILVRTDVFPNKGQLENESIKQRLLSHAQGHNALCYFASVGILNAFGTTEEEMARPVRGNGYYAAFEGLEFLGGNERPDKAN
jgi:hypothetical protein